MIRKEFLPLARPDSTEDEINNVVEVIKSGWWTTGPKVTEFENTFSDYLCHNQPLYTVGLNSCTAALHLSLLALGIKPGDEVIVPTWTFASTAQVVEWIGAIPVLCDIDEKTLNIDVEQAELLITSKTRALIPVHIAGYPCDMDSIKRLATKFNLKVIEDAAHAIGTKYRGVKIGNYSDITCFSFYATKNLAMGEGGAAVSRDPDVIEKVRKLSYFGINKEAFKRYLKSGTWIYDIEEIGYKNNLDSLHAAIGLAQLRRIDIMNQRRRDIAQKYREALSDTLILPVDDQTNYHTYHLFIIRIPEKYILRDNMVMELKKRNIGTNVHFIPLHMHSYYKNKYKNNRFNVADKLFKEVLSIPMFPSMTDDDVEYVSSHINTIMENRL
ncbi:MAG: DegT/DnrJ/EryC1/StrS family aminotransferase [bacterium]